MSDAIATRATSTGADASDWARWRLLLRLDRLKRFVKPCTRILRDHVAAHAECSPRKGASSLELYLKAVESTESEGVTHFSYFIDGNTNSCKPRLRENYLICAANSIFSLIGVLLLVICITEVIDALIATPVDTSGHAHDVVRRKALSLLNNDFASPGLPAS